MLTGKELFISSNLHDLIKQIAYTELGIEDDDLTSLSIESVDLIERFLCKDPAQRIPLDEALIHSWIFEQSPSSLMDNYAV